MEMEEIAVQLARINQRLNGLDDHIEKEDEVFASINRHFKNSDNRLQVLEMAIAKRNAYLAGAIAAVSILWGAAVTFWYMIKRAFNGS